MERILIFFFSHNNQCIGLKPAILKLEVLYKIFKYYSIDSNVPACQQKEIVELINVKINLEPR